MNINQSVCNPINANYVIQDQIFEDEKVENLKQEIISLKVEMKLAEEERDEYMSLLGGMHKQLNDLSNDEPPKDIEQDIKNIAKRCAGSSKSFNKIIDDVVFDSSLPISIQNSIEKCLMRKLGVKPNELNFYGLIKKSEDDGLLNDEALDYVHSIRKQRNIFAHTDVNAQTRFSRISFVLNSAALLWTHLECGSK
jgi:hypothetical protein